MELNQRAWGALVVAAMVAGCVSATPDQPRYRVDTFAELATRPPIVEIEHDEYSKLTVVEAERVATTVGRDTVIHSLRAFGGGQVKVPAITMRVKLESGAWVFLDRAYDRSGRRFEARRVARDVTGAGIEEIVAVELDRAYLETRRTEGLDLKVIGSRGEFVVTLPPSYVTGFLAKYDQTMRELGLDPMQGAQAPRR